MGRQTQTGRHVMTEDWSDGSTSQETPKIAGKWLDARKRREGLPYRFQREYGSADTP